MIIKYIAHTGKSSDSDDWEKVTIDYNDIYSDTTLSVGEYYTLDLIDNKSAAWGWFLMDDVTINPLYQGMTVEGTTTRPTVITTLNSFPVHNDVEFTVAGTYTVNIYNIDHIDYSIVPGAKW